MKIKTLKFIGIVLAIPLLAFLLVKIIPNSANAGQAIEYSSETRQATVLYNDLAQTALDTMAVATEAINAANLARQNACSAQILAAQLKYKDTPESMTAERTRLHNVAEDARACRDSAPATF